MCGSNAVRNLELSMPAKKTFLFAVLFLILGFCLWAGDSAVFADLGFSSDGTIYMFAQYGVQSGSLKPWADLYVVDAARNSFVNGGKVSFVHDKAVTAGNDGSAALFRLIARNAALAEKHKVDFMNLGQPLYIAVNGGSKESGQTIEFRDFTAGNSYKATLVSYTEGSGPNLKSSFFINLEYTSAANVTRTVTVGNPQIKRPLVEEYRIVKVIKAPQNSALIFVIEMKKQAATGFDIRYMVESAAY